MIPERPEARVWILAASAFVTLFLSRPGGIFGGPGGEAREYAETLIPPFDPGEIERIAGEMRLAESHLRLPPGFVFWKEVVAKVTAYEPSEVSCPGTADGITSLGDNAWHLDGVAADYDAIPKRTLVWIPGLDSLKEVDDTGSAMRKAWREAKTYHIDLRMTYVHEARQWGVKMLPIRLYRKAPAPASQAPR